MKFAGQAPAFLFLRPAEAAGASLCERSRPVFDLVEERRKLGGGAAAGFRPVLGGSTVTWTWFSF